MGEKLVKLHKDENLFHVANYKGNKGHIHLEKSGLIYEKEKGTIDHTISIKNINKVEYRTEAGNPYFIVSTNDQKYQYKMSNDAQDKLRDEELYFALNGLLLSDNQSKNFIKDFVDIQNVDCNKMFNNFVIARIMESDAKLRHDEKYLGALYGRYCPSFTNHYYGILAVTNQRVFFFDRIKLREQIERSNITNLNIIRSFDDYHDQHGRRHYNIEFNQSNFIVDVLTKREVKIETFYRLIEPEKPLDWSF